MQEKTEKTFGTWAILELMGHVKLAGFITEENRFGVVMGRIDIPNVNDENGYTQYFGGSSVYRITPVSEAMAKAFARCNYPRPIQRYELQLSAGMAEEYGGWGDSQEDDYDPDIPF